MIFNSLEFAIFLPTVLVIYYALNFRAQNILLLGASWLFYGWWDYRFLSLLLVSTVVDYACARGIGATSAPGRRRLLLWCSIGTNLAILGTFKYFNFFTESADAILQLIGWNLPKRAFEVILPVGISFYTFQSMGYTVDVYRNRLAPFRSLSTFALYVSYFPQLVAGPIERATHLLPQLAAPRRVTYTAIRQGCLLILLGLFRKVGIADALAPLVETRFARPELCSGPDLLFAVYLFAIQIYCDFAGYSNIARGTSKLLGIDLMVNFKQPYFSQSITEFWRRWHISLSTWLRDYVYIPLGGNRHGKWNTYRNLMLTMLLGGLWHGANWTFVVWGGLHGSWLAMEKSMVARRSAPTAECERSVTSVFRRFVCIALTFHLVCLAWVFFRSDSISGALTFLETLLSWRNESTIEPLTWLSVRLLVLIGLLVVVDLSKIATPSRVQNIVPHWSVRGAAYAVLVLTILTLGGVDAKVPFIYFQF